MNDRRVLMSSDITLSGSPEAVEANWKDRWYNGYSNKQRSLANRPQREERYKRGNNPTTCCMTGYSRTDDLKGAGYMFTHLENYDEPLNWYPMSKRAHYLLHRRFLDPKPWMRLVARNYRHGAWFILLTMNVSEMYEPFKNTYPNGLPEYDQLWPQYADKLGVSQTSFAI